MSKYTPLLAILFVITLSSAAIAYSSADTTFMPIFMGLFFVIFAMLKFFDLRGFAKGFKMYDLVAMQVPAYALAYPFLELALGLSYLSGIMPVLTNIATIILMAVSMVGVIYALARGLNVRCACLGTALNVPLSTVSVVENLGMGAMAAYALLGY